MVTTTSFVPCTPNVSLTDTCDTKHGVIVEVKKSDIEQEYGTRDNDA